MKVSEKDQAGVISTIRSKNGMGQISSKGKDKIQDKKEKSMCEDYTSRRLFRYELQKGVSLQSRGRSVQMQLYGKKLQGWKVSI